MELVKWAPLEVKNIVYSTVYSMRLLTILHTLPTTDFEQIQQSTQYVRRTLFVARKLSRTYRYEVSACLPPVPLSRVIVWRPLQRRRFLGGGGETVYDYIGALLTARMSVRELRR